MPAARSPNDWLALIGRSAAGLFVHSGGQFRYFNDGLSRILAIAADDVLTGRVDPIAMIAPTNRRQLIDTIKPLIAARDGEAQLTLAACRADGQIVHLDLHFNVLDDDGSATVLGIVHDVTLRRRDEQTWQAKYRHFAEIFRHSPIAKTIVHLPTGRFVDLNDEAVKLLGIAREDAIGRDSRDFAIWEDPAARLAVYAQLNAGILPSPGDEVLLRTLNGSVRSVSIVWRLLQWDGERYAAAMLTDLTDRNRAKTFEQAALRDALTGLPNRLHLSALIEQALARAKRFGTVGALLFLDLDAFKNVNDTWGHAAGDELLQQVAERLKGRLRAVDVVARLGGDEFIVVIEAIPNDQACELVASDLIRQMQAPFELGEGRTVTIGMSIGISRFPQNGSDLTTLLRQADQALYRAKGLGRNRFVWHDDAGLSEVNPTS